MKKDGTRYLAQIQYPNGKTEWMVLHWGRPPAILGDNTKGQWLNGFMPPKIKEILKFYELEAVLAKVDNAAPIT